MLGIGPLELALVLLIVLVLFGAKRLPETGRSLGAGMREFKEGIMHPSADDERRGQTLTDPSELKTARAPSARAASGSEQAEGPLS